MKINGLMVRKNDRPKDDFLRSAYIHIAAREESPVDVLTSKFEEVEEFQVDALVLMTDIEMDFTCSIGYNRLETYTDYETRRDSHGNPYTVNVTKTRTVTDYQPYKGNGKGSTLGYAYNVPDDKLLNENSVIPLEIVHKEIEALTSDYSKQIDQKNYHQEKETIEVNEDAKNRLYRDAERNFFVHDVDVPGDTFRDLNFKSSFSNDSILVVRLPHYKVQYLYNGKKFEVSGPAFGGAKMIDRQIRVGTPKEEGNKIAVGVQKQTKSNKGLMIAMWIIVGVVSVVSIILGNIFYELLTLFSLLIVLAIGLGILFTILYVVKRKRVKNKLVADRKQAKLNNCKQFLLENGFEPLSKEEIKLFDKDFDDDDEDDEE